MNLYHKSELEKIVKEYDPDHDLGPDAPVHYQVERLASAVLALYERVEELEDEVRGLEPLGR